MCILPIHDEQDGAGPHEHHDNHHPLLLLRQRHLFRLRLLHSPPDHFHYYCCSSSRNESHRNKGAVDCEIEKHVLFQCFALLIPADCFKHDLMRQCDGCRQACRYKQQGKCGEHPSSFLARRAIEHWTPDGNGPVYHESGVQMGNDNRGGPLNQGTDFARPVRACFQELQC